MTVSSSLFSSNEIRWLTPKDFFEVWRDKYNINLDVCASPGDEIHPRFIAPAGTTPITGALNPIAIDGLVTEWSNYLKPGEAAWMNPPYGRDIKYWVNKARREWELNKVVTVCLLPSRTDTKYFQNDIIPIMAGRCPGEVKFIKGRLKFKNAVNGETGPAPFPSVVVVFGFHSS
jgi:hypothetical protein